MSEGAVGGGIFATLCSTGLQTFCNTNHAGSGSNSRQSGCFPSNWCGAGEDDAFDAAEAKDKAKLARQQQTAQPRPTPAMSRPSDATTAVDGASVAKGGELTPKAELGPVTEAGPAEGAVGGGLASSPVVQALPKADGGEGITREELQARKEAEALSGGVVTGPGSASSPVV